MYWTKSQVSSWLLCYFLWWLEQQKARKKQDIALKIVTIVNGTMATFLCHTYVQEPALSTKVDFFWNHKSKLLEKLWIKVRCKIKY